MTLANFLWMKSGFSFPGVCFVLKTLVLFSDLPCTLTNDWQLTTGTRRRYTHLRVITSLISHELLADPQVIFAENEDRFLSFENSRWVNLVECQNNPKEAWKRDSLFNQSGIFRDAIPFPGKEMANQAEIGRGCGRENCEIWWLWKWKGMFPRQYYHWAKV